MSGPCVAQGCPICCALHLPRAACATRADIKAVSFLGLTGGRSKLPSGVLATRFLPGLTRVAARHPAHRHGISTGSLASFQEICASPDPWPCRPLGRATPLIVADSPDEKRPSGSHWVNLSFKGRSKKRGDKSRTLPATGHRHNQLKVAKSHKSKKYCASHQGCFTVVAYGLRTYGMKRRQRSQKLLRLMNGQL